MWTIWRMCLALSWVLYGMSVYLYYSDGEKQWGLSVLASGIVSLITFGSFYLINLTFGETDKKGKIVYPLVALLPGLLVYPTASFVSS